MSNDDRFVPGRVATEVCGVHADTIRKWGDTGLIRCKRTPGGQRRYHLQSLKHFIGFPDDGGEPNPTKRKNYIYAETCLVLRTAR